jgi:hypothetical protein
MEDNRAFLTPFWAFCVMALSGAGFSLWAFALLGLNPTG